MFKKSMNALKSSIPKRYVKMAKEATATVNGAQAKVTEIPMTSDHKVTPQQTTYNITVKNDKKNIKLHKKGVDETKIVMKWMPVIGEVVAITLAAVWKIFGRR